MIKNSERWYLISNDSKKSISQNFYDNVDPTVSNVPILDKCLISFRNTNISSGISKPNLTNLTNIQIYAYFNTNSVISIDGNFVTNLL